MTSHRWRLTIAYLILAAALAFVAGLSVENQNRIERQAEATSAKIENEARRSSAENCRSINEAKQVLLSVLESLAAQRDDDDPGDFEHRQRLLDQVTPLVKPNDCPPGPPRGNP